MQWLLLVKIFRKVTNIKWILILRAKGFFLFIHFILDFLVNFEQIQWILWIAVSILAQNGNKYWDFLLGYVTILEEREKIHKEEKKKKKRKIKMKKDDDDDDER